MHRYCWLVLTALITLVLVSPVFASGQGEDTEDVEVTELNVWFGREAFIPGDEFEQFHEDNPNIRINADVIPLEEAFSSYVRAARAGEAPDMVQALTFHTPALAGQDMLMDITPILEHWEEENPEHFADMAPATWDYPTIDGTPHGMALHTAPYWYIYRTDLFEEHGISEPEYWSEAVEAGRELTTLDGGDMVGFSQIGFAGHIDWFISYFIYMGGQYSDDNVIQLDSEAGVALLEFYQTMMADGIAHPDTISWDSGDMRANFMGGNAAQAFEGANLFAEFNEHLDYGTEWRALPGLKREGAEDEWRIPGNSWPYLISTEAEDKVEAMSRFLQYLSAPEITKEVAMRYQPSTTMSVFDDEEYQEAQPWMVELREWYEQQVPIPVHERQPEINDILGEAMQEALDEPDADAGEMAARYQEQIDNLVNE